MGLIVVKAMCTQKFWNRLREQAPKSMRCLEHYFAADHKDATINEILGALNA